ncbi:hypothetical protein Adt_35994 [Abeliophyllum distichum]|uniref:Uncharacterized protein n=1 Tax=Abeliophyllum distichum TaxID=126358 RepID=A0ABD1QGJ1_9LAMI
MASLWALSSYSKVFGSGGGFWILGFNKEDDLFVTFYYFGKLLVDNVPVVRGYADVFLDDVSNIYRGKAIGFCCHWSLSYTYLIGTLPDKWQDVAEMVYDLLWALAVPILPREIHYEAFYAELMALWEEAQDDALKFLKAKRVPSEMRICEDALSPISDVEE